MISIHDLDKYECVSFDIYDTLVLRNVETPSHVFKLVENEYNSIYKNAPLSGFMGKRIEAEKKARKAAKREEITIYDIYESLSDHMQKEKAVELMKLELLIEKDICVCNDEVYNLFRWCKNQNKITILTSDMYLPKEVIIEILKKAGISDYDKLYLSSDLFRKKSSGSIFSFILDDLNIEPENMVHIGDSISGDYESPRKFHISSILYKRPLNREKINKTNEIISAFVGNKINHAKGEAFKIGYRSLGPVLFGFTYWLSLYVDEVGAKQILFLSRDGKVIQEAWNYNKCIIQKRKNIYFYASRKALIIPSLKNNAELGQIGKRYSFHKQITLHDILNKVGVYDHLIADVLQKYTLDLEKLYDSEKLFSGDYSEINDFFKEIKPVIEKNACEQSRNVDSYMKQFELQDAVLIVDIGWNGNMQKALESYLSVKSDVNLFGAYVAMNPLNPNQQHYNMRGFLCDAFHHNNLYDELAPFGTILETFFAADHGSVAGYTLEDDIASPIFEEYEFSQCDQKETIREIQEGALAFVEEFSQYALNNRLVNKLSPENYIASFLDLCRVPSKIEANIVGNLPFYDTNLEYLVADTGNGRGYWKSFCKSRWKIGFLRKTMKWNLNYYHIYKFLKKLDFRH